jgi:S-adenosylmethionine:tRNA ribosyltransferase-isomerase
MKVLDVVDFDFDLPPDLIAQEPPPERGASRLLFLNRAAGTLAHSTIAALPGLLVAGDVLVINNTRVFPARLIGRRVPTGGEVEWLLIRHVEGGEWEALVHPGQKLKPGAQVVFEGSRTLRGEILERRFHGRRLVRLWTDDGGAVDEAVDAIGHVPLPPYIKRDARDADRERYQTIFARSRGSIAAPTAGLHFTPPILAG